MSAQRRELELNEPGRPPERPEELAQHLISASNELYLHELLCRQIGRPVPPALARAHASIRAELKRLCREVEETS